VLQIVLSDASHHTRWIHAVWTLSACKSVLDCNFVAGDQCRDLENRITSHNLNIFITGKGIDCHPSPVIHLLRSISGHPSISGLDPYPGKNHLRMGSISCHPSPVTICGRSFAVVIHLVMNPLASAICFHPVHNSAHMGRIA